MKYLKIKPQHIWLATALLLASCITMRAQTTSTNPGTQPAPQNNVATQPPAQTLPEQLGFTPQQIQQWREINREFRNQEMGATFKLRQARLALNDAMESQPTNEEVIKQRAKEVADAQSAVTQLQALRQARVMQMLTPEQRVKLKEIKDHRDAQGIKQPRGANALAPRQQLRRNANPALLTPEQRKALRQQQKKQKP